MIGLYVGAALKNKRLAMLVTAMLILLYLFIFTIIQLQDYSLLIGSIGLFLVLAAIMYLSRNIDWYNIDFDNKD
jgi:inner membrane protein